LVAAALWAPIRVVAQSEAVSSFTDLTSSVPATVSAPDSFSNDFTVPAAGFDADENSWGGLFGNDSIVLTGQNFDGDLKLNPGSIFPASTGFTKGAGVAVGPSGQIVPFNTSGSIVMSYLSNRNSSNGSPTITVAPVPEPAEASLALGLMGFALAHWKRRRKLCPAE